MLVQKYQKGLTILNKICIKAKNSPLLKVWFLSSRTHEKSLHLFKSLEWENHLFFSCIKVRIIRGFQKLRSFQNYLDIRNHLFRKLQTWSLPSRSQSNGFQVRSDRCIGKCCLKILPSISRYFDFIKIRFLFLFFWAIKLFLLCLHWIDFFHHGLK